MNNGFILLARKLLESGIWLKPPAYLKIWLYILFRVNFKDSLFPRGSNLFNWNKDSPNIHGVSKNQFYETLKWLKRTKQITTQKSTRGVVIKVLNYEKYQDIKKYLSDTDSYTETETIPKQSLNNSDTIIERSKEEKEIKNREGKSPPSQIARKFFSDKELQKQVIQKISEKYNADLNVVTREIGKFVDYWTELNKSGTRQKWETQNTFEVDRRIKRWLENIKDFQKAERKIL